MTAGSLVGIGVVSAHQPILATAPNVPDSGTIAVRCGNLIDGVSTVVVKGGLPFRLPAQ